MTLVYVLFYDLETVGQKDCLEIIEFAGIAVHRGGFYELPQFSFHSLIKPEMSSNQGKNFRNWNGEDNCNGISWNTLKNAPPFAAIADRIFTLMDGHIWAGHNIVNFDNPKIVDAFARLGRPPPRPAGVIDTYRLFEMLPLRDRLGNLKLNTCGQYCNEPQQDHRSLSDVRLNIAVLKKLMTVLSLETIFPFLSPSGGIPPTPSSSASSLSPSASPPPLMACVVTTLVKEGQSQRARRSAERSPQRSPAKRSGRSPGRKAGSTAVSAGEDAMVSFDTTGSLARNTVGGGTGDTEAGETPRESAAGAFVFTAGDPEGTEASSSTLAKAGADARVLGRAPAASASISMSSCSTSKGTVARIAGSAQRGGGIASALGEQGGALAAAAAFQSKTLALLPTAAGAASGAPVAGCCVAVPVSSSASASAPPHRGGTVLARATGAHSKLFVETEEVDGRGAGERAEKGKATANPAIRLSAQRQKAEGPAGQGIGAAAALSAQMAALSVGSSAFEDAVEGFGESNGEDCPPSAALSAAKTPSFLPDSDVAPVALASQEDAAMFASASSSRRSGSPPSAPAPLPAFSFHSPEEVPVFPALLPFPGGLDVGHKKTDGMKNDGEKIDGSSGVAFNNAAAATLRLPASPASSGSSVSSMTCVQKQKLQVSGQVLDFLLPGEKQQEENEATSRPQTSSFQTAGPGIVPPEMLGMLEPWLPHNGTTVWSPARTTCNRCVAWRHNAVVLAGAPAFVDSRAFDPRQLQVGWATGRFAPAGVVSGGSTFPQLTYGGQALLLHDGAARVTFSASKSASFTDFRGLPLLDVLLCLSPAAAAAVAACQAALEEAVEGRMRGQEWAMNSCFIGKECVPLGERQRTIKLKFPVTTALTFHTKFYKCTAEETDCHCLLLSGLSADAAVIRHLLPRGRSVDVVFSIQAYMMKGFSGLSCSASSVVTPPS